MSEVLNDATLVLNRSWTVVNTTTVRRALTLAVKNVAKIIVPETFEVHDFESWRDLSVASDDPCIKSVALRIRVPEVIVLLTYDAIPKKEVPFTRRNLYQRDRYSCQYCGKRTPKEELTIDHVVPRSKGGRTSWRNCVLACVDCNVRKGSRTLEAAGMKLVRAPLKPRWEPHLTIPIGQRKQSWQHFISEKYWNTELTD
jgi:5-methylcytosine-specific restriction endonuclease McrA